MVDKEVARLTGGRARAGEVRAGGHASSESTEHAPAEFGAFLDLHRMILDDPELCEVPKALIRERRCNAEWALVQQMEQLVAQFDESRIPICVSAGRTSGRWSSVSSRAGWPCRPDAARLREGVKKKPDRRRA